MTGRRWGLPFPPYSPLPGGGNAGKLGFSGLFRRSHLFPRRTPRWAGKRKPRCVMET